MRMRRVALITISVFLILFVGYLGFLYRQLEQTFNQQNEFIPTRIYSDVTRIMPSQSKAFVQARLSALGYQTKARENQILFTLHPINYPAYLVPEGHPTLDSPIHNVALEFDSNKQDAALQSIRLGEQEIPDLYLEPELVATLSRSNAPGVKKEIREHVKFQDVPASLWKAIIAIEDQHFLEHHGLDPKGILRAIWVNLRSLRLAQGGSTITQQLVKNLMARRTRNIAQKINELFLAVLLEIKYDKEQILERYLNEVYLGQVGSLEIHGVSEGAKHFFGKRLTELNLSEMALMAGLIRGPAYYSPYRYYDRAIERQRLVLKKMVETNEIAEGEAAAAMKQTIRLAPPQTVSNKAPYFVDFVKAELIRQLKDRISEQEVTDAGFRVYTTLDVALNSAAQAAVAKGIAGLEQRLKAGPEERLEGALASVDHTTGFIRALVGGRSYAQSTFNRILNMRRQVGSTFKPLVYLTALARNTDSAGIIYGPAYPMEDGPWTLKYDHGRQEWAPKNYEKEFMGWVSLRTALAHSINTVAAKLGWEVGIPNIIQTARDLGIESDLPKVPSLALGVAELSPVELLRAYATIANHGVQDELTAIRGITQDDGTGYARFVYHPKQVFDPAPIDVLTDMLQTTFTEGTAREAIKMGFDRPAAGKTGTTSHHRDSWFAGFTPQLTTVVWVGLDNPPAPTEKTKNKIVLTGATSALPIWVNYMKEALSSEPPTPFTASSSIRDIRIDRHTGKLATSDCPDSQVQVDKYISGKEPGDSSCEAGWPQSILESSE